MFIKRKNRTGKADGYWPSIKYVRLNKSNTWPPPSLYTFQQKNDYIKRTDVRYCLEHPPPKKKPKPFAAPSTLPCVCTLWIAPYWMLLNFKTLITYNFFSTSRQIILSVEKMLWSDIFRFFSRKLYNVRC